VVKGDILRERCRFEEAVECYQMGVKFDPKAVILYTSIASIRML
jgi:hypothetical protein